MWGKIKEFLRFYFSPLIDLISKLRTYLSDKMLITDLITKFVITFGVVLIVGGLYLMMSNVGGSSQVSSLAWVPGVPFSMDSIANYGVSTIGLVSWFVGLDLFIVGLGLWVRDKLARYTALIIFFIGVVFQFLEFMNLGIMGSPASITQVIIDLVLIYFLSSRFDSPKIRASQSII